MPAQPLGSLATPDGATLYYLTLGEGELPVAVIPGAGDGLETLERTAGRLRLYFARRRREFRLVVLSRRQPVPAGFSFERHAEDLLGVLQHLSFPPCLLECNSGGGPIGQIMAVRAREQVRGLVLSSTLHRSNPHTSEVIHHWLHLIARQKWAEFSWSSIEMTFRPGTVRWYRLARPLLHWISPPPRDPSRIVNVLTGLLDFDHRPLLPQIACPALATGGEADRIVPAEIQREMASLIPGCELKLYPGYGHGNDQENPAYEADVRAFARKCFGA